MYNNGIGLWLADISEFSLDVVDSCYEDYDIYIVGHLQVLPLIKYNHCIGNGIHMVHISKSVPCKVWIEDVFYKYV